MRLSFLLGPLSIFLFVGATTFAGPKPFPVDTGASCITSKCHKGFGQKKFLHEPASDGEDCTSCHEAVKEGSHSFKLAAKGKDLCFQCHDEEDFQGKAVHEPVAEGACTDCHSPHQSDNPQQLLYPPTKELCFQCHDEEDFAGRTVHGPVKEGKCISCHSPHASNNPKQLLKPVPELCLSCHNVPRRDFSGEQIPPVAPLFNNQNAKLHKPFKEGKCISCHFPHASNNSRLLVRKYPSTLYSPYSEKAYALCLGCHQNFKKILEEPRTITDTNFRNGNLNLHYRHVVRKKGRSCRACHHHHGSTKEKLIRPSFVFGKRNLSISYDKGKNGGTCAPACHQQIRYDRLEPVFVPFKTTPRRGDEAPLEELKKGGGKGQESQKGKIPVKTQK